MNIFRYLFSSPPKDAFWEYLRVWAKSTLGFCPKKSCPLVIGEHATMNAVARFHPEPLSIHIKQHITNDIPFYTFVLVHEYMHYIHFSSVGMQKFNETPSILLEGFADYTARLFLQYGNYQLPANEKRILGVNYEYARQLVRQLCLYESGIKGFFSKFLKQKHADSPWHELNDLFPQT